MSLIDRFCGLLRAGGAQQTMLLFFAAMFLLSQVSIAVVLKPVGLSQVLMLQTTLSTETFRLLAADLYQRGVAENYLAHYYYDFLHPVWYSTLLALLLAAAMNRAGLAAGASRWLLLPFVAGLLDLVENSAHIYMLVDTARISPFWVLLGNGAALLKWTLLGATLVAVLVLFARPGHNR